MLSKRHSAAVRNAKNTLLLRRQARQAMLTFQSMPFDVYRDTGVALTEHTLRTQLPASTRGKAKKTRHSTGSKGPIVSRMEGSSGGTLRGRGRCRPGGCAPSGRNGVGFMRPPRLLISGSSPVT